MREEGQLRRKMSRRAGGFGSQSVSGEVQVNCNTLLYGLCHHVEAMA